MTTQPSIDIPYGPAAPDYLAQGVGKQRAEQVNTAAARTEADLAKLLRPDGTPVWGPAEHTERAAALVASFDQAAQALYEQAERDEAAARATITALDGADPLDRLDAAELARANSLRAFIAEEAADVPLTQLLTRLRAVLATATDRAALVLWQRYAGKRWDTLMQADRDGQRSPMTLAEHREFRSLLDQLSAAVADPSQHAKRDAAITTIATARALQQHITRTRARLDGTEAQRREAHARYVRGLF